MYCEVACPVMVEVVRNRTYCWPGFSTTLPVLIVTGVKTAPDGAVSTPDEKSAFPVIRWFVASH